MATFYSNSQYMYLSSFKILAGEQNVVGRYKYLCSITQFCSPVDLELHNTHKICLLSLLS